MSDLNFRVRHDMSGKAREQRLAELDTACEIAGLYYPYDSFEQVQPGTYRIEADAATLLLVSESSLAVQGLVRGVA